jgi:hypothetical protein
LAKHELFGCLKLYATLHADGTREAYQCSYTINRSRYRALEQWAIFSEATHESDERPSPSPSKLGPFGLLFQFFRPRSFGSVQYLTKWATLLFVGATIKSALFYAVTVSR